MTFRAVHPLLCASARVPHALLLSIAMRRTIDILLNNTASSTLAYANMSMCMNVFF